MKLMRGQAGIEYMALFALVAIVLLAASYYFYSSFQAQSRVFQARIAVDKIASAADAVASQGQGSTKQVTVYFPSGLINATTRGREVFLVVAGLDGRTTDVYSVTLANLSFYQFPLGESRYVFNVTFNSSGNVSISG
ncbi:MAG: hypothetical protein Q8R15_01090 [Candidatus Micrarchaeota archaeon]|nr:hypothetical protein [Candidatus Micrarchaeota archaeon]